jgi:succinyl-diaminopimelate desuccinylase
MTTIELFKKLLQFHSITPNDDGAFEFIKSYLPEFEVIEQHINETKNLFLYKKFGEGVHLNFAGHIDVVPPGEGWSSDPFDPEVEGDVIYARGTQDMKSGVAASLYALRHTNGFDGTLSILLTSDEEGDAKDGTIKMLEHLKEIDFLPDYSIVAEPTCEREFGDAIKVGRRGSINGIITVQGVQGHAAYPETTDNPINKIASVLPQIAGVDLDNGDEAFAPSKFVITDIRSGMEVTNVTPSDLKMMFNVRNSTKTTQKEIKQFLESYFHDKNSTITMSQSAYPFVTSKESPVVQKLLKSIKIVTDQNARLSTSGGTSDARFIAQFGIEVVEFGVVNDTIHKVNERTNISYVEALEKVFSDVIKQFKGFE